MIYFQSNMNKKIILSIIILSFILPAIIGCGTVRSSKKQEIQILKSRITQLESEISLRDKRQKETERLLETETQKRRQLEEGLTSQKTPPNASRMLSDKIKIKDIEEDAEKKSVSRIQLALKNAGFDPGKIDGKLGPRTERAIIAFQKANDLVPDGIVGRKTWAKLKVYSKW